MGRVKIRWCHTCSVEKGKLVELSWLGALKHWLKRHRVREGVVFKI